MILVTSRNVNHALPAALAYLAQESVRRPSRNGDVAMFRMPVTTMYVRPTERVLFDRDRDANPFFHFFEALWMLAGRNDVSYVANFANAIRQYSDNGRTFNGAYGFRWRNHFGKDQLDVVVERLRKDPTDRRCVIQMWDGNHDLDLPSKDVPCNTAAYVSVDENDKLNLTVTNRSNDLIWGCYGANAVHFSMLQEYLAGRLGLEVGYYWQVSNNLHKYDFNSGNADKILANWNDGSSVDHYSKGTVTPFPMFTRGMKPESFDQDLEMFQENPFSFGFQNMFFRRVAIPMQAAWAAYRRKELGDERFDLALLSMEQCVASDWKIACVEWLNRRRDNARAKAREKAAS